MSSERGGGARIPAKISEDPRLQPLVPHQQELGRYSIRFRLATGGMAGVFIALFRAGSRFQKWVALKVVHPHLATERAFIEMFLDEARIVSRLNHPNVCSVFDSGDVDGVYYLAMEYMDGAPLGDVIRQSVFKRVVNRDAMARIVADAARGLHAAHELRDSSGRALDLVHRDVSPQNIFVLSDGIAKVLDFGIARSRDRLGPETEAGQIKGKLAYLSPEQVNRQPVDRRSDVFALGIVLWEATLGSRLFKRDVPAETILAITEGRVPRPTSVDPSYPVALEAIVMKALSLRPADRYANADQMARELDAFVASRDVVHGPADVSDFMRALFGRDLDERRSILNIEGKTQTIDLAAHGIAPGDDDRTEVDGAQDWESDVTTTPAEKRAAPVPVASHEPTAILAAPVASAPPAQRPRSTMDRIRERPSIWIIVAGFLLVALLSAVIGALAAK